MDVWKWVGKKTRSLYKQGHHRLVEIIGMVASLTSDGEHGLVDAMVPEGVALARELKEEWVEVFLRHWHLQSLVLHRSDVKTALPEAISLLDFSTREQTRDCPQSICVIQDMASCYGQCDGPGYADERLALAGETLARITPAWDCYVCISAEYSEALVDAGRHQQALDFLAAAEKEQLKKGVPQYSADFVIQKVRALAPLGRYREALASIDRVGLHRQGKIFDLTLDIYKAWIFALSGELVRARNTLPEFAAIEQELSDYEIWLEARYLMACGGEVENDWRLGALFEKCLDRLEQAGIVRHSITVAGQAADLALRRGSLLTAEYLADRVQALIPSLHRVLDAEHRLAAMRKRIEQQRAAAAPCTGSQQADLDGLLQQLPEDPEQALALLDAAGDGCRGQPAWVLAGCELMLKMGRVDAALGQLRAVLARQPDSPGLLLELGRLLLLHRSGEELLRFVDDMEARPLSDESKVNLLLTRARYHDRQGQTGEVRHCLDRMLDTAPTSVAGRRWLAALERDAGNYRAARAHIEQLLGMEPDDTELLWEQCITAALMQDWNLLAQCAGRLGFDSVSAQDPVDQVWEHCRIATASDDTDGVYMAVRTGPVTARITGVAPLNRPQCYADHVVFHPRPLDDIEQDDETGSPDSSGEALVVYRRLGTIMHGNYLTFDLDGVHPGQAVVDRLKQALERLEVVFVPHMAEDYMLYAAQQDEEYPGFYAFLLCPPGVALQEVDRILAEHCRALPHPLVWTGLLEAVGDRRRLGRQQQQRADYGID